MIARVDIELNACIDEAFSSLVKESWLRQIVEKVLAIKELNCPAELSLVITNDQTVQELNWQYRGIYEPTDVLSFALNEEKTFINPPDGILHLGEVIISYPQAVKQAEEYGHPVEKELALLIIHGILHLLGYEHDEPEKEREMRGLEEKILGEVLTQG